MLIEKAKKLIGFGKWIMAQEELEAAPKELELEAGNKERKSFFRWLFEFEPLPDDEPDERISNGRPRFASLLFYIEPLGFEQARDLRPAGGSIMGWLFSKDKLEGGNGGNQDAGSRGAREDK
jgi:hypothetical protein